MSVKWYDEDRAKLEEMVGLLKEMQKHTDKRLDSLHELTDTLSKSVFLMAHSMEVIGKRRSENCNYSRDGYCVHIANAIPDPKKEKRNTTKIDGKYYPCVERFECYHCSYYEIPPSEIAGS